MAGATMDHMRQLYGQPRDGYQGTKPPAVAEIREPARLVSVRPTGAAVLVCCEIAGALRLLRIERSDSHELSVFSASDRARIGAAVGALHRAGREDGGPKHAA